jgi:hypothetical protein
VEHTEPARNLRFIFNIERLIEYVTGVIDEGFRNNTEKRFFHQAEMKRLTNIIRRGSPKKQVRYCILAYSGIRFSNRGHYKTKSLQG